MARRMLVVCPARRTRARALGLVTFVTAMVSAGVSSRPAFGAAADDKQLALAGAGAVKIVVRGAGWVRVGQPALVAAGLDPSVDPARLQLHADGVEQAIVVTGDGNNVFAAGEAIEFWGAGRDTQWTDARTYWLTAGGGGARVATAAGGTATLGAATFARTERLLERAIYIASVRNGDESNFFGAAVSATPTARTLAAHHLDASQAGEAVLRVTLQGVTVTSHAVDIAFNGTALGAGVLDGQERGTF